MSQAISTPPNKRSQGQFDGPVDKWNIYEFSELHSPHETGWPWVVLTTDLSLDIIWKSQHHFSTHNRPAGTLLTILQEKKRVAGNNLSLQSCSIFLLVEITLYRDLSAFPVFSTSTSGWEIGLIKNSAPLCSRDPISAHPSWTSSRSPI